MSDKSVVIVKDGLELVTGHWRTNACDFLRMRHPEWKLSAWDSTNCGHWILPKYAPQLRAALHHDTVECVDDDMFG